MKYRYREPHELKESGIEWIGKIPKEWKHVKLRYLCKIDTGGRDTQDNEEEGEYPFFVRSDTVERINSYSFDGEAILTAGDGVGVGKVFHYYNGKFDFHQRVYKLSDFKDINGKYLYYFIKENFYKLVLKISAKSTVDSLRMPMFKDFEVSFPEKLTKQFLIASFLDKKCAEFDGIVEKKESIISKLEEAKKSLISEVVTGKVKIENGKIIPRKEEEMKDSGIDWIGKIPKEWEVKKLKSLAELNPKKSEVAKYRNMECSFVPMEKLRTGSIELDTVKIIDDVFEGYTYFKNNDIIMAKVTPCFENRNIAIAKNLVNEIGFGSSELYVFRKKEGCYIEFLYYFFQTDAFVGISSSQMTGAGGLKRVPSEFLQNMKISICDINTQSLIVSFLDKKTAEIENVIIKIRDQIEKIKKAKQSLISEAVTGKIEVMEE